MYLYICLNLLLQGTIILPNFWGTNMDDGTWVDPYTFKPERFLNERSEIVNAEKIVTFGLGIIRI